MLARWAADPEVTRWVLWPPYRPDDRAAAEHFLASCAANWEAEAAHRPWMIVPRDDAGGEPVGMIGVTPHGAFAVEIGYVLGRASWGRGYAPEAAAAVVAALFRDPLVWRVFATAHVDNARSHRVLEKAGLRREGVARRHMLYLNIGPEPQSSALYAITRDDLAAAAPTPR